MSLTPSSMMPLGTPAPDFRLPDTVTGEQRTLADYADSKLLLVMFICNHCPYVLHLQPGLLALARDYAGSDVSIVAISANDAQSYPDDAPERMASEARRLGYPFAYLYDESQDVARAYGATCTPDFFVFDAARRCAYRGQFDASRPGNGVAVSGSDIRAALDALLQDRPVSAAQQPSVGCNIKWKQA